MPGDAAIFLNGYGNFHRNPPFLLYIILLLVASLYRRIGFLSLGSGVHLGVFFYRNPNRNLNRFFLYNNKIKNMIKITIRITIMKKMEIINADKVETSTRFML
jgi:hypothetical protein